PVSGETVTLYAEPRGGFVFDGWSGACSGTSPECAAVVPAGSADVFVVASFRPANRIFVTSVARSPAELVADGTALNPGSEPDRLLAGADALCRVRATAAGLGGTRWVSWLSS